jgi:hypothetical protein
VTIHEKKVEDAGKSVPDQISTPITLSGESRRRFTKSGLAVSGVILTLVSRPGMATDICASASGSLSGGLQSHHGPAPVCVGVSPGFWKNRSNWPKNIKKTTLFGSVYACNGKNHEYKTCTLLTMLSHQSFDQANLGMHLVAAYLNAQAGYTSFLTVASLQTMFSEWQNTGYYSPTAGVKWHASDIVTYLSGTMN